MVIQHLIARAIRVPISMIEVIVFWAILVHKHFRILVIPKDQKIAVLELNKIDRISNNSFGRLTYTLLFLLQANGYKIYLKFGVFNNLSFFSTFRTLKYKKLALEFEPWIFMKMKITTKSEVILISDNIDSSLPSVDKKIYIDYESAEIEDHPKQRLAMPYIMHPQLYHSGGYNMVSKLRLECRKFRAFFSGTLDQKYDNSKIVTKYGKLSRVKVLEHLTQNLSKGQLSVVRSRSDLDSDAKSEYPQFVLIDTSAYRIEQQEWLQTLANCDFFLGCPGVSKPMSHNVVEAMAVGCIPILEYPEFFHPKLVHMENCVVFNGEDDLLSKVQDVLAMDPLMIQQLRSNTVKYYETYLTPEAFGRKLQQAEDEATLYFLAQNLSDQSLL